MSVLKMKTGTQAAKKLQNYLEKDKQDKEKNRCEEKYTSRNVFDKDNWAEEMDQTREMLGKDTGRKYYHIMQSFENENKAAYNPKDINKLGIKLADEITKNGDYQYAVITHNDTNNLHNHIVINSVDCQSAKKLQINNGDIKRFHSYNDELSREMNLHTLDESKKEKDLNLQKQGLQPENRKTDEIYLEQKENGFKAQIRTKLQQVFSDSDIKNDQDFTKALEKKGLHITRETGTGNITYGDEQGHKVRAKNLGNFNRKDINELLQKRQLELEKIKEMTLTKSLGMGR